ncbi:MAG: trimeric intracellular cation channel family protein [Gemmataceae bacterium]|nr:trimeric intracellular cation channel family protein [Gemmataceae bacterium]
MKLPYLIDLIAVGVFAVSGCLAAGRKSLDWVGVLVIAVVTAMGGGTLRDLLLNRHPLYWTVDPNFLYVIAGAVVVTIAYVRYRPPPEHSLLIVDAIGLSIYSIVGAQIAEDLGRPAAIAVVMGTLTGTAGGVIRDMLVNDIPILFREGYLYATAAMVGATLYVLTQDALGRESAAFLGMATVAALRFVSIIWKWKLPRFKIEDWSSP